jgi:putative membrane protein
LTPRRPESASEPMSVSRTSRGLWLLCAAALLASWIRAPYPDEMLLQHIPTVILLAAWPTLARRFPLSAAAVTCLALFLLLHVLAARYLYSNVPYDDWSRRLFGFEPTERFGFRRNHFDRLVHFGALWVRPIWEICVRYCRVPRRFAYYAAVEFVLAWSMLYELIEWGLSLVLAGADADAYNGQQGDMWDAQKDTSFALLGAGLALLALFFTRRGRKRTVPRSAEPSA